MSTLEFISNAYELILILLFIFIILKFVIMPYFNKKNELREKEIKNKLNELYSSIDPESVDETINKYFQKYIDRYIVYKFISIKCIYIKQADVDLMIKDLTKLIALEISELYIYYIKLLNSISSEEELITYIHTKVMNLTIESVSNYNKSID